MPPLTITPLGAGSEVGRSCLIASYQDSVIMFDCGLHPAYTSIAALPLFDAIDLKSVEVCLVTHFHLDHCGALPYLLTKTQFRGRVLMTEATLTICKLIWMDYVKMSSSRNASEREGNRGFLNPPSAGGYSHNHLSTGASTHNDGGNPPERGFFRQNDAIDHENALFDIFDVQKTMKMVETIDFRQQIEVNDIKISCFGAGHVLGACMFMIEIDGVRVLYTGDYSREVDRHIPVAEIPEIDVHVLICEATYGIRVHDERKLREKRFLEAVQTILDRNGKCLLPVFALGRAQELLLILEEYWEKHPKLHQVPLIYISSVSEKCMIVYETCINMGGDHVRKLADKGKNPFQFQFVKSIKSISAAHSFVHNDGPCVIMAAPGMLQNGVSREIFECWAPDARNGVILTGYTVKGTLADDLKKEPDTIQLADRLLQRKCGFEQISFSAHADFHQTQEFIETLRAPNVILVHGEKTEMQRLKNKLTDERPSLSVFTPNLLQKVSLTFPENRCVRAIGRLADDIQEYFTHQIKKRRKKAVGDAPLKGQCIYTEKSLTDEKLSKEGALAEALPSEDGASGDKENFSQEKFTSSTKKENQKDLQLQLNGLIVCEKSKTPCLMYPQDLKEYTDVQPTILEQKLRLPFNSSAHKLIESLSLIFEKIEVSSTNCLVISDILRLKINSKDEEIELIWKTSNAADLIADAVTMLLLTLEANLDSLGGCSERSLFDDKLEKTFQRNCIFFLQEKFMKIKIVEKSGTNLSNLKESSILCGEFESLNDYIICFRAKDAVSGVLFDLDVDMEERKVSCANDTLRLQVMEYLKRLEEATLPLVLN